MSNKFDFVLKDSAAGQKITFKWNGQYSIGSKGGFEGVTVDDTTPGRVQIAVSSSRHASDTAANWYRNFVGGNTSHMVHTARGSNDPDGLNFAIKGTLTIGEDKYEICLGQGSYGGTTNNWHLCSESINADENNKDGFLGKQQYYLTQSGNSGFDIQKVSDMKSCRTNDFLLKLPGGLEAFKFTQTDYSISDHQPYAGIECSHSSDSGTIRVKAGRHKTPEVKEWFFNQVHPTASKGAAIGCDAASTFPTKLNFAVRGTLELTVLGEAISLDDVVIAQGSVADGVEDNWWLGGPNMHGLALPLSGVIAQKIPGKNPLKLREATWASIPGSDHRLFMQIQNIT